MRARSGWLKGLNPTVALASKGVVLALVLFGAVMTDTAATTFVAVRDGILAVLGWWYVALATLSLGFVLWLALGKVGSIRLGGDDERPEFSRISWFAMLFSAGMGIGLVFWGVAEPVSHLASNPFVEEGAGDAERARVAMRIAYFHWGLHPWAIYALVGAGLGYFGYRRGLPLTIRSTLYPLLGDRIYGPIGHAADTLAVFATTVGVATSLGLGVQQINAGLEHLVGLQISLVNQLILIAIITAAAVVSVASGLDKGIKLLSHINLWLAAAILAMVAALGPTSALINQYLQSTGDYIQNLIWLSLWTDAYEERGWQAAWTTFYWGWWISWSPFVGMFIARISRGRTIREFVIGVLLAPTLVTFAWLTVLGGTALSSIAAGDPGGIAAAVADDVTLSLYAMIEELHPGALGLVLSAAATMLVALFFITSSDSGTLVTNTILSVGNPHPPLEHRILWGVSEGAVAAVLLAAGGLTALQAAAISAALPFSFVLTALAVGLAVALVREARGTPAEEGASPTPPINPPTIRMAPPPQE